MQASSGLDAIYLPFKTEQSQGCIGNLFHPGSKTKERTKIHERIFAKLKANLGSFFFYKIFGIISRKGTNLWSECNPMPCLSFIWYEEAIQGASK